MKKTYIAPSIRVREVELTNIIATSWNNLGRKGNGVVLSRESGWDDEDDDF